jgi:hypothetical protein
MPKRLTSCGERSSTPRARAWMRGTRRRAGKLISPPIEETLTIVPKRWRRICGRRSWLRRAGPKEVDLELVAGRRKGRVLGGALESEAGAVDEDVDPPLLGEERLHPRARGRTGW